MPAQVYEFPSQGVTEYLYESYTCHTCPEQGAHTCYDCECSDWSPAHCRNCKSCVPPADNTDAYIPPRDQIVLDKAYCDPANPMMCSLYMDNVRNEEHYECSCMMTSYSDAECHYCAE